MAQTSRTGKKNGRQTQTGITRITVCGYKSIAEKQSVEIRPLTILAGANSSGKSSMLQPLLLMKQTLEAGYDPGTLLLNGKILKFTEWKQLLPQTDACNDACQLQIGIEVNGQSTLTTCFGRTDGQSLEVQEMVYDDPGDPITLRRGMTNKEIEKALPAELRKLPVSITSKRSGPMQWTVTPRLCFLYLALVPTRGKREEPWSGILASPSLDVEPHIRNIIHLPGLRGNPERDYPVTSSAGSPFSGTFQVYTAGVINKWQEEKRSEGKGKLAELRDQLVKLGLTWTVEARRVDDTRVELRVGRLPRRRRGGEEDLVSIADVGLGTSQVLPVLVALLAAKPGQMVYMEQPEIHLHPNAQHVLAQMLIDAAKRGVRVVAETHSSLLIRGVQTHVAEGKLDPAQVKLHWFGRREDGSTEITSRDLDESGAFGDWPEDFDRVELDAQIRYLDAAEKKLKTA